MYFEDTALLPLVRGHFKYDLSVIRISHIQTGKEVFSYAC